MGSHCECLTKISLIWNILLDFKRLEILNHTVWVFYLVLIYFYFSEGRPYLKMAGSDTEGLVVKRCNIKVGSFDGIFQSF